MWRVEVVLCDDGTEIDHIWPALAAPDEDTARLYAFGLAVSLKHDLDAPRAIRLTGPDKVSEEWEIDNFLTAYFLLGNEKLSDYF